MDPAENMRRRMEDFLVPNDYDSLEDCISEAQFAVDENIYYPVNITINNCIVIDRDDFLGHNKLSGLKLWIIKRYCSNLLSGGRIIW